MDSIDRIFVELEVKLKSLDKLDTMTKKLDKLNMRLNSSGRIIDKTNGRFVSHNVALNKYRKMMDGASASSKMGAMRFFGLGMSMLFLGMSIKRASENILRSTGKVFMDLADAQNAGVKRTMELTAAMGFLKYAFFDALANTDLYASFVGFVVDAVFWFTELIQNHPGLVKIMAVFLGIGLALGSISPMVGNILLLFISLSMAGVALTPLLIILGLIAIAVIAIAAIWLVWKSDMSTTEKVLWTIVIVIGAVLAILILLGVSLSLPFIIGAILIGVVLAAFALMIKRTGSVKDAFKLMGLYILEALAGIGDFIVEVLIFPLRIIIGLINAAIRGLHKMGIASNLSEFQIEEGFGLGMTSKVDAMRKNFLAKTDENNKVEISEESQESLFDKVKKGIKEGLEESEGLMPTPEL